MVQCVVLSEDKIPTPTLGLAVMSGLIFGIGLSFLLFSPEQRQSLNSLLTNFGLAIKVENVSTPPQITPTVYVDSLIGHPLSGVVITELPHTTVTLALTTTPTPSVTTPVHTERPVVTITNTQIPSTNTPSPTPTTNLNTSNFSRKVLLINVDPQVQCPYKQKVAMSLHECLNWNNPHEMAPGVASFFSNTTNAHVKFTIKEEVVYNSFTEWSSGCFHDAYWAKCSAAGTCSRATQCTSNFKYTQEEYFRCMDDPTKESCLYGETNMRKLMNTYGLPAKVNDGSIDEVWLYGAPWMSMWESQAIGPKAFDINAPSLIDTAYKRTIVMMPMSYERDLGTSIHNFSHRFEATMSRVYGGWAENRTNHNWDRFGLVKAQSPSYSYSGCGSGHFPPNAVSDYDYGNSTNSVATTCDTFFNYPDVSKFGITKKNVTCTEWGCTEYGYFGWWMKHFPKYKGVGTDGKANDWWYYLLDLDNVFKTGQQVTNNQ